MIDVCVIGAGVSGLAAATFLGEAGQDVQIWEASDVPGGNVRSEHHDGRILDRAANGWLDNEPAMDRLIDLLGLRDRTVSAQDRTGTRWILSGGVMQPAPLGPLKLLRSQLISPAAKLRLALEPLMPRGASAHADDPTADESVGDFVRRRLGPEFVDQMVGPMVAGIYASDPDELSLRGAFKRLFELEKDHRSLFIAMARGSRGGRPPGHLQTLKDGAGELTTTMARRLGDRLTCDRRVTAIARTDGGWDITGLSADGRTHTLHAKHVVLSCPAPAQARIIQAVDPAASDALAGIPYGPVAVVSSAWARESWSTEPDGFGVLLARGEAQQIDAHGVLGTLFTSCIFPEHTNKDEVLLRTILGGAIAPEVAAMSDQELIAKTRRAATVCLGSERKAPHFVRVYRHEAGIPCYRVGHPGRVAVVRAAEARHPGLFFIGNHLDGVGVKDCARAAETVSSRIVSTQTPAT